MKKVTYLNGQLRNPRIITLEKIVSFLKAEKIPKAISEVRDSIPYLTPEVRTVEGNRIPAVIFSSVYKENAWMYYTGLVLIEFNRLPTFQEAYRLRDQINLYKKPLLVFVGCSGRSVKVVVRYTLPDGNLPATKEDAATFHAHAYLLTALHYEEQFNRKADQKEPVLHRVCRLSWDPDCYFHPNTPALLLEQPDELPEKKDIPVKKKPFMIRWQAFCREWNSMRKSVCCMNYVCSRHWTKKEKPGRKMIRKRFYRSLVNTAMLLLSLKKIPSGGYSGLPIQQPILT
ncbi:MAG: hypothetical protein LIP01_12630 [Tannerellaceae bacterium]|nr:hypothetical protein [Tannerellaceae bacterium]